MKGPGNQQFLTRILNLEKQIHQCIESRAENAGYAIIGGEIPRYIGDGIEMTGQKYALAALCLAITSQFAQETTTVSETLETMKFLLEIGCLRDREFESLSIVLNQLLSIQVPGLEEDE